ncbi:hypothetical protein L873DRAFT_1813499 [Choiromyces venosus 120613-1]|uniref:Uncharacterized protein n=1 Tax=Choiromyces venosus 120613-1 TaxID=1336337 RepID=A0A3N4J9G6_9PEZI|nr:hypothetical protein L873DRAFT_1813499 [Choiromyces venosus 120613-1]
MPVTRTAKKNIHRSPIIILPRRSQRPTAVNQEALLNGMKQLPPPVHSQSLSTIPSSPASLDSLFEAPSSPELEPTRLLTREDCLPVKKVPTLGSNNDGGKVSKGWSSVDLKTPSMRLTHELQAALDEAEKAGFRNRFDDGESTGSRISLTAKRVNRRATKAKTVEKVTRTLGSGQNPLKGKRNGVTKKKKKAAQKSKNLGLKMRERSWRWKILICLKAV